MSLCGKQCRINVVQNQMAKVMELITDLESKYLYMCFLSNLLLDCPVSYILY